MVAAEQTCLSLPRYLCLGGNWCSLTPAQTLARLTWSTSGMFLTFLVYWMSTFSWRYRQRAQNADQGVDVRKELSIACCECLNCTGGKVGILSVAPLSLPSQELNINHMRRRKVVLIKVQRCFNVRISVSDGYQLRKKIKEAGQDSIISRIEVCFHLWL